MTNKTKIKYPLGLSIFLAILLLGGCVHEEFQVKGLDTRSHKNEVPIRILAETNSKQGPASSATAKTRGNVDSEGTDTWQEQVEGETDFERTIQHVTLFAYKVGNTTTPEKVVFYYPFGGSNPLGSVTSNNFEIKEFSTVSTGTIALDLGLETGNYNFVLLVNSRAALEKLTTGTIPNPSKLVEKNEVFTSDDLKGTDRKYLPMVGQKEFNVPAAGGTSPTSPKILNPAISLERVHARIEFRLTTSTEDESDYLSSILPNSEITNLELINEMNGYVLLPSDSEYTATGGGSANMMKGVKYATNLPSGLSSAILTPARANLHGGANDPGTGKIAKYKNRLLPYSDSEPKYIYVASGIYSVEALKALTLKLSVRYLEETQDREYKIPLYNPDVSNTDNGYFHIRRNTIYRIDAKLQGPDLLNVNLVVDSWVDVGVDIVWG